MYVYVKDLSYNVQKVCYKSQSRGPPGHPRVYAFVYTYSTLNYKQYTGNQ